MKRLLLILSLLCAPVFASTVITPALCKYHAILTINHAKCGSAGTVNLSNASYLLTAANLPAAMVTSGGPQASQADCGDICFTTMPPLPGSTRLGLDPVSYTQNASPGSATAQLWVGKIPTVYTNNATSNPSGLDTQIVVWWGSNVGTTVQPAANATGGSQAVWGNGLADAVWHLEEASSANALDSTVNGYTLTDSGTVASATGQIGKGRNAFTTSAALTSSTKIYYSGSTAYTIEAWAYFTSFTGYPYIIGNTGTGSNQADYELYANSNGTLTMLIIAARNSAHWDIPVGSALSLNTWYHVVFAWDGAGFATGNAKLYLNGVDTSSPVTTSGTPQIPSASSVGYTRVGNWGSVSAAYPMLGTVDEVRIINGYQRSYDWVKADFNNQSSPSTFWKAAGPVLSSTTSGAVQWGGM